MDTLASSVGIGPSLPFGPPSGSPFGPVVQETRTMSGGGPPDADGTAVAEARAAATGAPGTEPLSGGRAGQVTASPGFGAAGSLSPLFMAGVLMVMVVV